MALDRSRWLVGVAVLLALTAASYAPILDAGWVHEDRVPPPSRGLRTELVAWATAPTLPRGLTALTQRLQGSASVRAVHLGSLAIHLTNGALLSTLLPPTPLGLLAVCLFLLHPINSEAVNYLSARADLIYGTALLLTLVAVQKGSWMAAGLVVLGLLGCWQAKESGVAAVALVALWQVSQRKTIPIALAVVVLVGGYASGQYLAGLHTWIVPGPSTFRFLGLQAAALWRMVLLVVVPWGFTIEHDWQRLPSLLGMALFLLTIACGVVAWQRRAEYPRASFALLWALVALAPRWLVIVPHGVQEHHFYVPLMGLWLAPGLEAA